ncbi:MAG TPA: pseudouridine synthase [Cytophagaceae bacterium]|jgi:23S rRNA pseudouridine955/2504/2580 synthase|nr:pseudouridine synthase [Cytophagaceae bacterium]
MKIPDFKDLILFEDEDYILVNKPPYVSTLDDRADTFNIKKMARAYSDDAQVCHRLDKETSGVLAIAKNPEAYRHLAIQFEDRKVTKEYHAVVDGVQDFQDVNVYLPIHAQNNGIVKIDRVNGKLAETFFNTIRAYKKHTLVQCLPITGRMHQIRIHLTCLKAPIVCDEQYGGKMIYLSELKKKGFNLKQNTEEQPLIKRVALHAYSLKFTQLNGKELTVVAPYPKDFDVLVKQLEKHA